MNRSVLVLSMVLALLAGCSTPQPEKPSSQTSSPPSPAQHLPAPPQALVDAAEYAENLYDMAKAKDWVAAKARFDQLKSAVAGLPPARTLEIKQDMEKLEKAITAKAQSTAQREANAITLRTAELQRDYKVEVPVEIAKLDYYGRELEVWSGQDNAEKLKATAGEMRSTWEQVRAAVEARDQAEARKFADLVAKVEAARSVAEYRQLAKPVLDEVDNLEKAFRPKP